MWWLLLSPVVSSAGKTGKNHGTIIVLGWPKSSFCFFHKMLPRPPNELSDQRNIWTWAYVNLSFCLRHLLALSPWLLWANVSWKMEALADLRRKFCRLKELMLVVLGKEWVPSKWHLPSCVIWLRLWCCCIANTLPLNLSGLLRYHRSSYVSVGHLWLLCVRLWIKLRSVHMCLILQSATSWGMHFSWQMTEIQEELGRNLPGPLISHHSTH